MKKNIFALFQNIEEADKAINHLHNELKIPAGEISYLYKNKQGEKISGDGDDVAADGAGSGALTGATAGGAIGAVVGLIGVAGLLGPLGPVVVAGPLATALGITGTAGAVVGTGIAGATLGGLVGALTSMGVSEPKARDIEERVDSGAVLLSIQTDDADTVVSALRQFNPSEIEMVEENL